MIAKRMTAKWDGDLVVFLIGMRVNRWWKPQVWLPVSMAMPKMIKELTDNPELGFLGAESYFGRTTLMLQYWKSAKHLMSYAKARNSEHLPAWKAFNQRIGTKGDVGIWHETYVVPQGNFESIYVNMPAFGLGRVAAQQEVHGQYQQAARRLHALTAQLETPTVSP
jgi:hypothetical protein